jgi:GNAT superfamily N-acetyltransferase
VEIRPVGADDLEQEIDLRVRAFGPLGGYRDRIIEDNLAVIAAGQMLGAYDGGRLTGTARCLDLRQWWGGRAMPMAGVSGVKVAPEARGRGVAKALLTELMSSMTRRGYPVSLLYPSTAGLYRAMGWEFAGGFYRTEIAARALTSLLPPDSAVAAGVAGVAGLRRAGLRRAGPDDAEQVIAVMDAVHEASGACGPTSFGVDDMRRGLAEEDEFAYLADDGFLSYGFDGGSRAIEVNYLAAGSPATAAAIWGILGSHSTVTRTVSVFISPSDPIGLLLRDSDIEVRLDRRPMLRVIDPVAAVAGRGFPMGVQCTVHLRLTDAALPANSGDYRLTVRDGTGTLVQTAGPQAAGLQAAGLQEAGLHEAGLQAAGGSGADGSGAGRSDVGGSGAGRLRTAGLQEAGGSGADGSDVGGSGAGRSGAGRSGAGRSGAGGSGAGGSGAGRPGAGRSEAGGSGAGRPGAGRSEAGGSGAGRPGAGRPLVVGARGFAALFAGTPVSTLRVAGLADGGDPSADALIDSAFACRPFMTDSF